MGMLDVFRRVTAPVSRRIGRTRAEAEELFDDEFQRKLETLAIVSRRVFAGNMRAERRTKKNGSGVEFADHRNYAPGDDFRYVDWNVYQRFGKLLVRLYEEEEDLSIYFIVDCSSSMAFGDAQEVRSGAPAVRGARLRRARQPRPRHDRRRHRRGRRADADDARQGHGSSGSSTSCAGSSPTARPSSANA